MAKEVFYLNKYFFKTSSMDRIWLIMSYTHKGTDSRRLLPNWRPTLRKIEKFWMKRPSTERRVTKNSCLRVMRNNDNIQSLKSTKPSELSMNPYNYWELSLTQPLFNSRESKPTWRESTLPSRTTPSLLQSSRHFWN